MESVITAPSDMETVITAPSDMESDVGRCHQAKSLSAFSTAPSSHLDTARGLQQHALRGRGVVAAGTRLRQRPGCCRLCRVGI
jgi:hypothetical protein